MSEESRVYGCIVGQPGSTPDWHFPYEFNHAVIGALPTEDAYPPLTRGIFTVPMDYRQSGSAFYRQQIIHFGASFNHLSEYWHVWLAKFEELLRRLSWLEVRLHHEIELHGSFEYHWHATWPGNDIPWHRVPLCATTQWSFEGGPRDLRTA